MKRKLIPMKLQFFASDQAEGGGSDQQPDQQNQQPDGQNQNVNAQAPQIDYEKLAQIVSGKQTATEDSVLRGYFKQQGLTKEEVEQAMRTFKEQKAANQPDVSNLQTQINALQEEAKRAAVEKEAVLEAVGLGLDDKTIPYVLKMVDLNDATGADGKVNKEAIKNAINKVLEDVPQLKPVQESQKGFQVGGGGQQNSGTDEAALKAAFGL